MSDAPLSRLEEKLEQLPISPGVYLFKNAEGTIVYVGKARVLRNRVRSYFQAGHEGTFHKVSMVAEIVDLDILVTDSESEALALENNLIKRHQPPYNVLLRDDKNHPYLKLTLGEAYPRLIKDKLIDDPVQAPLQEHFYISQLRALLPLIALECKIRRIGGVDELGCRYVREWLKPTPGHAQPVVIRPLTFIRAGETAGDTVANMFIIAARQPEKGPCLLYRPLFEQPLLQFPSAQNLLYALHQPGELRDSVLAWLPDSTLAFKYANTRFPSAFPTRG